MTRTFLQVGVLLACSIALASAQGNSSGAPPGSLNAQTTPSSSLEGNNSSTTGGGQTTTPSNGQQSTGAQRSAPASPASSRLISNTNTSDLSSKTGEGLFWDFPVKLTPSLRMGYDTNVFTSNIDPISSAYTSLLGDLSYSFGGSRLQLEASIGGGITYYYSRPENKEDYRAKFDFRAKYKVNPRLQISVTNSTNYLPQPELSIIGGTNYTTNQYIYQDTSVECLYLLSPKLASVTSLEFVALYFMDEIQNESEGRVEETFSQSLQYLIFPKTSIVGEYRVNPVKYFAEDLSSFGQFLLLGVNQTFNSRLMLTVRGGAEYRILNNPVDGRGTSLGPFYESVLNYQFGPSSSLIWNVRYGTEASGLANVTQRDTFRMGLTATHALTSRITLSLGFVYQYNYYDQPNVIPDFYENVGQLSLGTKFQINRYFFLELGYGYTTIMSPDQPSREYDRQIVYIGGSITI